MKVKIINHTGDPNSTKVIFVDDEGKETELPVAFVELGIYPDKPLIARIGVYVDHLEAEAIPVVERLRGQSKRYNPVRGCRCEYCG